MSSGNCETELNGIDTRTVVIILLTIGAVLILVFVLVIVLIVVMGSRISRLKAALCEAAAEPVALSLGVSPREATGPEGQAETGEAAVDAAATKKSPAQQK